MRKFLIISIPIFLIALFILVMLSDKYLKHSFNDNDDVVLYIKSIKKDVEDENWTSAKSNTEKLKLAWSIVVKRVQFSAEKDEINGFFKSLARLEAAIDANNKDNALMELSEEYYNWENLGK